MTCPVANGASEPKHAPPFTALDYFDRNILVNAKISEIAETIHIVDKNTAPSEEGEHSCITYLYKFNKKGNLISETLDRVSIDYGFVYDVNDKLYDWTWKDKSSGETTSFREELKDNPEAFRKELADREAKVKKQLGSSIPYTTRLIRAIGDPCFGIEAEYEIIHDKTSSTLPTSARAIKIRDVGRFLRKGFKSPNILFISYDYKYFEKAK